VLIGNVLLMFRDTPSVTSSTAQQTKSNTRNTYVHGYTGHGVAGDQVSQNAALANRVNEA
jgi:hypothetical protein